MKSKKKPAWPLSFIPYGAVKMRYLPTGGCVPANKKEVAKARKILRSKP
jgi:hypothetical protein